jgi:UPF0176 protein
VLKALLSWQAFGRNASHPKGRKTSPLSGMEHTILTFYKFTSFPEFSDWKQVLEKEGRKWGIIGTIILAKEGINATISGKEENVYLFLGKIKEDSRFSDIRARKSTTERKTFYRLKIFLRDEIVTLGDDSINPNKAVGHYIEPDQWNKVIEDPEVLLVDTRNDYEVAIGTFAGAINPETKTFREWDGYVKANLDKKKHKKVAMFCTGGIRCEKASAHLLHHGFEEVYHLKGGILNYLEQVEPEESKWEGECFIFDHRVSLVHGLKDGQSQLCFGCRWPLSQEDLISEKYEEGVSCPKCHDSQSEKKKEGLRERQRQINLANSENRPHIGQKMPKCE